MLHIAKCFSDRQFLPEILAGPVFLRRKCVFVALGQRNPLLGGSECLRKSTTIHPAKVILPIQML
jgi:hypothetical protein